ncbi:MAG: hypothetical protein QX191_10800 [Methylococcaceae bacterium]
MPCIVLTPTTLKEAPRLSSTSCSGIEGVGEFNTQLIGGIIAPIQSIFINSKRIGGLLLAKLSALQRQTEVLKNP